VLNLEPLSMYRSNLSIDLHVRLSIKSIFLSIDPSIYLFDIFISLSLSLSLFLSFYMSVCPSN